MEITREQMLSLPRPTQLQVKAFVDYLPGAHSWYKCSLFVGTSFVVFLAPDAGGTGTKERPLEYGKWKVGEEYRKRFGHLDYMWSGSRDVPNSPVMLPEELVARRSFTLMPWGALDGAGLDVICGGYHSEDWALLEGVADHPVKQELFRIRREHKIVEALWNGLSDEEREIAVEAEDDTDERFSGHPKLQQWFQADSALWDAYLGLGNEEHLKVEVALAALQEWLYDK